MVTRLGSVVGALALCASLAACGSEPRGGEAAAPDGEATSVAIAPTPKAQISVVSPATLASESARDAERAKHCEHHAKPYPEIALTGGAVKAPAPSAPSAAAAGSAAPSSSGASSSGSAVGSAAKVVASMAPLFRRCYQEGLTCDREMVGSVRISARVAADGSVAEAAPVAATGLSRGVIDCMAEAVKSKRFDRPEGGSATLVIPVSFFPQP